MISEAEKKYQKYIDRRKETREGETRESVGRREVGVHLTLQITVYLALFNVNVTIHTHNQRHYLILQTLI